MQNPTRDQGKADGITSNGSGGYQRRQNPEFNDAPARPSYRGRFAPSPTGPLHLGSLTTAVASYLEARVHGGEWLLRIEDTDPQRKVRGAVSDILHTLEAHGLYWTGPVNYQSSRSAAYNQAMQRLLGCKLAYPCGCSRRNRVIGHSGQSIYPGTCRQGLLPGMRARTVRVRTHNDSIRFVDGLMGLQEQRLEYDVGDFVIRRAEGFFAYHLAVVVDDADQEITHVLRGADLLDSTPRQIHLQRCLGYNSPRYTHVPIVVDHSGQKLNKSSGARALNRNNNGNNLWYALKILDQKPPQSLRRATPQTIWEWAYENWSLSKIKKTICRELDLKN